MCIEIYIYLYIAIFGHFGGSDRRCCFLIFAPWGGGWGECKQNLVNVALVPWSLKGGARPSASFCTSPSCPESHHVQNFGENTRRCSALHHELLLYEEMEPCRHGDRIYHSLSDCHSVRCNHAIIFTEALLQQLLRYKLSPDKGSGRAQREESASLNRPSYPGCAALPRL